MVLGALFLVTLLLAAMPSHRAPILPTTEDPARDSSTPAQTMQEQDMQGMDHSKMPGMDTEKANQAAAVEDMSGEMHRSAHMTMTAHRAEAPGDAARANEIATELRASIAKYKDYHVALSDGFKIFLPNLPQKEYHFTSARNAFFQSIHFDPSRPTSLLYRKTSDGYELVGAMYTMPRQASEDQLDERIPLSIATWHLHTNLCMPQLGDLHSADWTKFGLRGSIATQEACDAAGGSFRPVVFGWMVHIYPYAETLDKMYAMHTHDD